MKMIDEKKAKQIIRSMPVTKSLDNGFEAEGWGTFQLQVLCVPQNC